jgi:hypothetical protein
MVSAASAAHCPVRTDKAVVNNWRAKLTGTDDPVSLRTLDLLIGNTNQRSAAKTHGDREQLKFSGIG